MNARLEHLKNQFLQADFSYRQKRLTIREYNEMLLEVFMHLLNDFDQIEPFYTEFRQEAEKTWDMAKQNPNASVGSQRQKTRTELAAEREYMENTAGIKIARQILSQNQKPNQ